MSKLFRQTTGSFDCKNKEILVGDIIHDFHYTGYGKRKHYYEVIEHEGDYAMKRIHDGIITKIKDFPFTSEAIIGNKFDNPELMEMY